jgi:HPt (histidine-containing phosphotransfer) domain-containing protein
MSEEKLIDMEELESITGGDQEIKQELFILFLYTIASDVDTLKRSIKRELRTEAEVQAHTMKGVAKSLAAKRVRCVTKRYFFSLTLLIIF